MTAFTPAFYNIFFNLVFFFIAVLLYMQVQIIAERTSVRSAIRIFRRWRKMRRGGSAAAPSRSFLSHILQKNINCGIIYAVYL